ncbi:MAG: hypothetical protein ACSHXZ_07470 [Gammaproteobacteria bacterium]
MPRAILAIRTYPATIILALLLFLATLLVTTGSLGKVRSGGDSGDGGSGMGGTGKSGEFGGSGFGGTGGPSPFFTSIDSADSETEPDAQAPMTTPAVILVQDAPQEPNEELNSPLQKDIIDAIDNNPLRAETVTEIAQGSNEVEIISIDPVVAPEPIQLVALPEVAPEIEIELLKPEASTPAPAQGQLVNAPTETKIDEKPVIAEEPQQLAETMTVRLETELEEEEPNRERNGLPERIQRPEIPPFQRIRPVQRPALLPPRVQPMRI